MSTWGTVAVASVPAAVAAAAVIITARSQARVETRRIADENAARRAERRNEMHVARLERMYEPVQRAYIGLVAAERELRLQSHHFSFEDYQRWNDETFRPAIAAVYVLGVPVAWERMESILAIYNAERARAGAVDAPGAPELLEAGVRRQAGTLRKLRDEMIAAMRTDIDDLLSGEGRARSASVGLQPTRVAPS